MPRYVLLEHDHPVRHWDLMLESGDALHTWRLPAPPFAGETLSATPIGAHRLAYLDYEGPVSGNRGQVRRWDAGTFTWVERTERLVVVEIRGERFSGTLRLEWRDDTSWLAQFGQKTD